MDSPQREPNPPTSELQESPFYKYLCTLSPIKTTKYLHVPQTYSEMTFPPPPTVFVSPRVSAHKGLSLLRRDSVSETALPAEIDIELELPPKVHHRCSFVADYGDQHMNIGSVKLEDKGSCFELAPKIHFGAEQIEQYPSEHSQCVLYGAELELNAKPSQGNGDQFCDSYEDGSKQNIFEKTSTKDSAENKKSMMDKQNVLAKKKFESMGQKDNPLPLSENSEGSMSRDDELNNLEDLVLHDVENLAREQSTFTVSVTNCNGASADFEGQSTVLVTLSSQDQKSVDFLENATKGLDIYGAARCITNEIPLHAVHFRDGELRSQIGTCIRASGVCSRGFRRRCLDFEISEALGEKVPISADDVEQTSEVGSDISIISPSSLCKRAAATSDAINTEDSNTDCLINCFSFVENHQTDGVVASMEPDTSKSIKQGAVIPIKDKVAGQNHQNPGSSCCSLIVPSGIGLHLNSLPTNIRTLMVSNENSPLSRCTYTPVVKKVSPGSDKVHPYCTGQEATVGLFASSGPSLVISLVEKTKTNQRATMTSSNSHLGVISSSTHFQSLILEQPQDEDVRKEKPSSSFEKMLQQDTSHIYVSEVGEASSQSPHSPKKRSSGSKDKVSEGCRHCKCKKSRCLKLYCECFAAGIYCIDSCTCHECFNKPEFEETVLETRQQIESRNPLAFAPKILRAAESSPADGEDLTSTPASGRHKRGCNCKRSMCLKKYCECYQAGVGCSEGCRCEGCKNIFGRKEGGEENEENEFQFNLADKDPIIGRLEIKPECSDQKLDCKSSKNISPITPSFPLGWEGKSSVKPRLRKRRITDQGGSPLCLPPAPNSCKPSKLLMPPCNLRKFSQQDIPQTSSNLKIPGSPSSKIATPNMNEFSPGWDGLADICTLTPLPQRPSRPLPASTIILDSTVVTMPLDEQDKVRPLQSLALTIASTMSGTPLQSTREKKRMHEISLAGCGEDLVDERLPNNIDETSMSFRTKTTRSSPKQKRVTPPHYEVSTNKPGTASSPSHRSPGLRKFILHALSPEKQQSHPGV